MAVLCCWLFGGCALSPLPRDLAIYLNRDIYAIAELETIALSCYAAQTGTNFVSDQSLRSALASNIIPAYERFSHLAGRIEPQTRPVQALHALYLKAAALRMRGFRTILFALETHDSVLVQEANRMLAQGEHDVVLWRTEMADLAKGYGLKLDGMTGGSSTQK